jgi:hypothetical protein
MRTRRQSHDQDAGLRITEAGDRLAPILPILISTATLDCHLLAPGYQTRAEPAGYNLRFQNSPGTIEVASQAGMIRHQ